MITGLIKPNSGRIFLDDEEITNLPMYQRAQKGLGYLAQEASVFRTLTVEDNLMAVMEMSTLTKEERNERLESLIEEFHLTKVRKSLGIQLSGGERRRCEIARALAIDPKFILLDEPFAGVDPIAVEDIQHIIAKLKTRNIGVVITDHNVHETLAITDRSYLLYEGVILESGSAEVLSNNPEVRKKYLGQNFQLRHAVLHNKKGAADTKEEPVKQSIAINDESAKTIDSQMSEYGKDASNLEKGNF
jgi:lipopolysaccharide export system ATP-binding protein